MSLPWLEPEEYIYVSLHDGQPNGKYPERNMVEGIVHKYRSIPKSGVIKLKYKSIPQTLFYPWIVVWAWRNNKPEPISACHVHVFGCSGIVLKRDHFHVELDLRDIIVL